MADEKVKLNDVKEEASKAAEHESSSQDINPLTGKPYGTNKGQGQLSTAYNKNQEIYDDAKEKTEQSRKHAHEENKLAYDQQLEKNDLAVKQTAETAREKALIQHEIDAIKHNHSVQESYIANQNKMDDYFLSTKPKEASELIKLSRQAQADAYKKDREWGLKETLLDNKLNNEIPRLADLQSKQLKETTDLALSQATETTNLKHNQQQQLLHFQRNLQDKKIQKLYADAYNNLRHYYNTTNDFNRLFAGAIDEASLRMYARASNVVATDYYAATIQTAGYGDGEGVFGTMLNFGSAVAEDVISSTLSLGGALIDGVAGIMGFDTDVERGINAYFNFTQRTHEILSSDAEHFGFFERYAAPGYFIQFLTENLVPSLITGGAGIWAAKGVAGGMRGISAARASAALSSNAGQAIARLERVEQVLRARVAAGTMTVQQREIALRSINQIIIQKAAIRSMAGNAAYTLDRGTVAAALGGLAARERIMAEALGRTGLGTLAKGGLSGVGLKGAAGLGFLGLQTLANINDVVERNKENGGNGEINFGVILAALGMTAVDAAGGAAVIGGLRPAKHWWGKFLQATPLENAAGRGGKLGRAAIKLADIGVDTGLESIGESLQTYFEMKGADQGLPDLWSIITSANGMYASQKEELAQAAWGGAVGAFGMSSVTTSLNKSGNILLNTVSKIKTDTDSPIESAAKLSPTDLDDIAKEDETFEPEVTGFKEKADALLKSKIMGVDKDGNIEEKGTVEDAKDLKHAEAAVENEVNNINEEIDKINKDIDDVETGAKTVSNGEEYVAAQKAKRDELEKTKKEQQEIAKKIREVEEERESIRSAAAVKDKIKTNKKKSGVTEKKINEAVDKIKKAKNNAERTEAIKEAMNLMDLDDKEISSIAKDINDRNDITEEEAKKADDDDDDDGSGGSTTSTSTADVDVDDTTTPKSSSRSPDDDTDVDTDSGEGTTSSETTDEDVDIDETADADDVGVTDSTDDTTTDDDATTDADSVEDTDESAEATDIGEDGLEVDEDINEMRADPDDKSSSKKTSSKKGTAKKTTSKKSTSKTTAGKKTSKTASKGSKTASSKKGSTASKAKTKKKAKPVKNNRDSVMQALLDMDDSRALVYYLGLNSKKGSRAKKVSEQIYEEVEIVKFDSADDLSLDDDVLSKKTGTRQVNVSVVNRYTWWIDEEGETHYFAIPKDSEAAKTLRNIPQRARDIYKNKLKGTVDSIVAKLNDLSKDPSKITREKIREVQAEIAAISNQINEGFDELGQIAQIIRILTLAHPNTTLAKSFGILAHNINLKIAELDQATKQLFTLCRQYKIDAKPFRMDPHKDTDTLMQKTGRISRFVAKLRASLGSVFGGVQDKLTESDLLARIHNQYIEGREDLIVKHNGQTIDLSAEENTEVTNKLGYEAKHKFTYTYFNKSNKTYESRTFESIKEAYEELKDIVKDPDLLKDLIKTALLSDDMAMDYLALNDFFDGAEFTSNNKAYLAALKETIASLNPTTNIKQVNSLFQFMGSALFKPLTEIFDATRNQKALMLRQQLWAIEYEANNGIYLADYRRTERFNGDRLQSILYAAEDLLYNTLGFKDDISTMRTVVKEMLTAISNDSKFWSQSGSLLEQFKDVEIDFTPSMWANEKKDTSKSKKDNTEGKAEEEVAPQKVSLYDLMTLPLESMRQLFTEKQLEAVAKELKIKKESGKKDFTDAQLDAMRAKLKEKYVLPSFKANARINKAVQNAILANKDVLSDITNITKAAIIARIKSMLNSNPIKADATNLDKLHFQDYYAEISMAGDILNILGLSDESTSDQDKHDLFTFGLFASNAWLKTLVDTSNGNSVFEYIVEKGRGPEGHDNKYVVISKKFISDLRRKHNGTITTIFDDILGKDPFRAMSNSSATFTKGYKGFRAGALTRLTQQGQTFVQEITNPDGSKTNSVIQYFRDVWGANVERLIDTLVSSEKISNDEYNAIKNNIVDGFKNNNAVAKEALEEDSDGNFVPNKNNPFLYMPISSYKKDKNGNIISREIKYVYMPDFLGSARVRKALKTDDVSKLTGQHLFESGISYFTRRASDISSGLFIYGNYKLCTRRDGTSREESRYAMFDSPVDFNKPVYLKYSLQDSGRMHSKASVVDPANKIIRDLASYSQRKKHKSSKDINHNYKNSKKFLADKKHSEGAFLAFAQMFGKDVDKFSISEEGRRELARIKNDDSLTNEQKREQIVEATIKYARYTASHKQRDPSTGEVLKDSDGNDLTVSVDLRDLFNALISNKIGTPEFQEALETYNQLFQDNPIEDLDPFEDSPHTIMANKAIFDKYLAGDSRAFVNRKGVVETVRFKRMRDLDTSKLQVLIDGAQTGVFENMVRFRGIAAFDVMSNVYRQYSKEVLDEMSDTQRVDNALATLLPHEVTDIMQEYEKLIDSMQYTGKELYYSERLKRDIDPYIMTMALMMNQMSKFQGNGSNLFISLAVNGNLLTRDAMKKIVLPYLYGSNSAAIYNTIMMESAEAVMSNLYTFLEEFQNSDLYKDYISSSAEDPETDRYAEYRNLPPEEAKQMLFRDYLFWKYSLGMPVDESGKDLILDPINALMLSGEYTEDSKSLINMILNIGDITLGATGSAKIYLDDDLASNAGAHQGKNAPIKIASRLSRSPNVTMTAVAHELQHRLLMMSAPNVYFKGLNAYLKSYKDNVDAYINRIADVEEQLKNDSLPDKKRKELEIKREIYHEELKKLLKNEKKWKEWYKQFGKPANQDKLEVRQREVHKVAVRTFRDFFKSLLDSKSEKKDMRIAQLLSETIEFLSQYTGQADKKDIIKEFKENLANNILDQLNKERKAQGVKLLSKEDLITYIDSLIKGNRDKLILVKDEEVIVEEAFADQFAGMFADKVGYNQYLAHTTELLSWMLTLPSIANTFSSWAMSNAPSTWIGGHPNTKTYAELLFEPIKKMQKEIIATYTPDVPAIKDADKQGKTKEEIKELKEAAKAKRQAEIDKASARLDALTIAKSDELALGKKAKIPQNIRMASIFSNWISNNPKENCNKLLKGVFNGENSRVNYHALSKNLFGDDALKLFRDKGNGSKLENTSSIIQGTIFSQEMEDINEYTQYFQITNKETELYFDDIFKSYWKPIIASFKLVRDGAGELNKSFFKELVKHKTDIIAQLDKNPDTIPPTIEALIKEYIAIGMASKQDTAKKDEYAKTLRKRFEAIYKNTVDAYIYAGEFLPEHTPSAELSIPPDVRIARRSGALASIMKTSMHKLVETNLNRVLDKTFEDVWKELRPGVEMNEVNVKNALTDATFAKKLGEQLNQARKEYYLKLAEETFDEKMTNLKTTLFSKQKNITAEMRQQFDALCKEVLKNYLETAESEILGVLDKSQGGYNNLNSYQIIVEKNAGPKGFPLAIKVNSPDIMMLPRVLGLYNHNLESAVMAEMLDRGLVTQQVFDGWQTSAAAATDSIASWNDLFTQLNAGVVDIPTFFNKIIDTTYKFAGIEKSEMSKYEDGLYSDFLEASIEYSTTVSNPSGIASINIRTPFEIANIDRANEKMSATTKTNDFVRETLISAVKYYQYMAKNGRNKKTRLSALTGAIFETIYENIDMDAASLADLLLSKHGDMITKQYEEDFKQSLNAPHMFLSHQTRESRLFNQDINQRIADGNHRYFSLYRNINNISDHKIRSAFSTTRGGVGLHVVNLTNRIQHKFQLNSIKGISKIKTENKEVTQLLSDIQKVVKKLSNDGTDKISLIDFAYAVASYRLAQKIISHYKIEGTDKRNIEAQALLLYKWIKAPHQNPDKHGFFFVELDFNGQTQRVPLDSTGTKKDEDGIFVQDDLNNLLDDFILDVQETFANTTFAKKDEGGIFIQDDDSSALFNGLNSNINESLIYGKHVVFTNQSRIYDISNAKTLDVEESASTLKILDEVPEPNENGEYTIYGNKAVLIKTTQTSGLKEISDKIFNIIKSPDNTHVILDLSGSSAQTAEYYINMIKKNGGKPGSNDVTSEKWAKKVYIVRRVIEDGGNSASKQSSFAPLNDISVVSSTSQIFKDKKTGKNKTKTTQTQIDVMSNLNFDKAIKSMIEKNNGNPNMTPPSPLSYKKWYSSLFGSTPSFSMDTDILGNTAASQNISQAEAKRMIDDAQKMTQAEFLADLKARRDKELSNPSLSAKERAAIKESYDALIDLWENAGKLNIAISKESHAAKGLQITNHNTRESSILLFANNDTNTALHEYIHALFNFALNQSSNVVSKARDQIYYIMKQVHDELVNNPELMDSLGITKEQFEYIFNNPNGINTSIQEFMATFLSTPKLAAYLSDRQFNINANRFAAMKESKTLVGKAISLLKGLIGLMYDIVSLSFFQSRKDLHTALLGISKNLSQYNTIEGMKAAQQAWENHPLTRANKFARAAFHTATRNVFKSAKRYMEENGLPDSYLNQVRDEIIDDLRDIKEPIEAIIEAIEENKDMPFSKQILLITIGILKTLWNSKRLILKNPVYRSFALQALNEARQQLVEGTWLDFKINIDLGIMLDKKFKQIKDDVDRINNLTNAMNIESEAGSVAIRDEVKGIILNDGFKNLKKWFDDNEAKDKDFRTKYENSISRFTWFAKLSDFWYEQDQIPKEELKDILERALGGKSKTQNEKDIKANINAAIAIIAKKNKLTREQTRKFKNFFYVGTQDLGYTRLARKHNEAGLSNVELMISSVDDVMRGKLNLSDKDFRDIARLLHKNVTLHAINHLHNKDLKYISNITNDAALLTEAYKNKDLKEDMIRMMSLVTQIHHDSEKRNNTKRELNWKEARKLYREGKNIADAAYQGRIYRKSKTFDRNSRHPFYTEGYIPYSRKPNDPYIVRLEKADPEFEAKRQYYLDAGFTEDIDTLDVSYMKYVGVINFAKGREELGYRFDDRVAMGHQNEYFLSLAERARLDIPNYNEWLYKEYMERDASVFDEDARFFKADSTQSRIADSSAKRRENIDSAAFESLTESDYTVSNLFYNQEKTIFANNTNNFINNTVMMAIIDSQDAIKSRGKSKNHKYHHAIPLFKIVQEDVPQRGKPNTKKRPRVEVANPIALAEQWGITFNRDDLANVANLLRTIGYDFTKAENKTIYVDSRTIQFLFGYNKNIYNSSKMANGKAQKIISGGFSFLRGLVRETRNNTIIRNPSLVWENFKSNIIGLFGEGIPPTQVFGSIPVVIRQLNQYQSLYREIKQLETQMSARKSGRGSALSNYEEAEQRLKSLKNSLKDNPLYDFMQSGGFYTNIVQDAESAGFKWDKRLIDKFADKAGISDTTKAYIKEAALTDESSLYQALEHFTRLGDFVPRVIYANHLIEHEGLSKAEAIKQARNRFINYNTPLWSPVLRNLDFFGGINYAKYGIGMQRQVLEAFANSPVQTSAIMAIGLAAKASGVSPLLSPNSYLLESVFLGDGLPKGLITGHIMPFWNNLNRWNYIFPNE